MTVQAKCVLVIPHKIGPLSHHQMAENYGVIERWVKDVLLDPECACPGCPEDIEYPLDKCFLHVPTVAWSTWQQDWDNLDAIERWAVVFLRDCACQDAVIGEG